ncbi:MAG: hypothetical protein GY781_22280 [Gammaproteobacteria bacterium]|nr:hypothetical protein [Gammaproteobacteria bacterium]
MKTITTLLITSVLTMTTQSTSAQSDPAGNSHFDYATVVKSEPVYRTITVTEEEQQCYEQEVVYRQPLSKKSGNPLIGGILGAAVGHALGHRSKHRKGATIAGAFVGASIASGNGAANNNSVRETRRIENRCKMIPISWEEERLVGYDVIYKYNGKRFETRMPFKPNNRLKIRVNLTPVTAYSDELG